MIFYFIFISTMLINSSSPIHNSCSIQKDLHALENKRFLFNTRLFLLKSLLFNKKIIPNCKSQIKNLSLYGRLSLDNNSNILFHYDNDNENQHSYEKFIFSHMNEFNQCYKENSFQLSLTEKEFSFEIEKITDLIKGNLKKCVFLNNKQDCIEMKINDFISNYHDILDLYNAKLSSIENMAL